MPALSVIALNVTVFDGLPFVVPPLPVLYGTT
jgi:hypothetical protein